MLLPLFSQESLPSLFTGLGIVNGTIMLKHRLKFLLCTWHMYFCWEDLFFPSLVLPLQCWLPFLGLWAEGEEQGKEFKESPFGTLGQGLGGGSGVSLLSEEVLALGTECWAAQEANNSVGW